VFTNEGTRQNETSVDNKAVKEFKHWQKTIFYFATLKRCTDSSFKSSALEC